MKLLPSVLIVPTCEGLAWQQLVTGITGAPCSSPLPFLCPWPISNRYYTADVSLRVATLGDGQETSPRDVGDGVEAVVLLWDPRDSDLKQLRQKHQLLPADQNAVNLLVCRGCDDVVRQRANAWCLEQHFELVELDGELSDMEDEEASSEEKETEEEKEKEKEQKEKVAFARIIEALQAHPWSNLKPKSAQKAPPPVPRNGQPEEEEEDLATMVGQLNQLRCSGVEAPRDQRLDMAERAALRVMEMLGFSDDEEEDDMRSNLSDDDDDFSDFVTCDSSVTKPINFPSVGDSIDYQ